MGFRGTPAAAAPAAKLPDTQPIATPESDDEEMHDARTHQPPPEQEEPAAAPMEVDTPDEPGSDGQVPEPTEPIVPEAVPEPQPQPTAVPAKMARKARAQAPKTPKVQKPRAPRAQAKPAEPRPTVGLKTLKGAAAAAAAAQKAKAKPKGRTKSTVVTKAKAQTKTKTARAKGAKPRTAKVVATDENGQPIKTKRKRRVAESTRALRAFKHAVRESTGPSFRYLPFQRLIRELIADMGKEMRMTRAAVLALREGAEDHVTELMELINLMAHHDGRDVIKVEDLHTVQAIRAGNGGRVIGGAARS